MKGEIYLAQDSTNIKAFQKLKGLLPQEKAAVMGLELFVGLQNYQQQFKDTNKNMEPARESESNVYSQVFTTCTHGVNIKTIEALEKLGYLQIESKKTKRKSNLIFEKLGFKQYKEVKDTKGNNPTRKPIKRVGSLLEILKNRNIDIETDEVGRKRINSKAERSFAKRVQDELVNENNKRSFREALQVEQILSQQENKQQVEIQEKIKVGKDDLER